MHLYTSLKVSGLGWPVLPVWVGLAPMSGVHWPPRPSGLLTCVEVRLDAASCLLHPSHRLARAEVQKRKRADAFPGGQHGWEFREG